MLTTTGKGNAPNEPLEALLTADEVADYLRVDVSTLRRWRARGEGPPPVRIDGTLRFRASAIAAYLREVEGN